MDTIPKKLIANMFLVIVTIPIIAFVFNSLSSFIYSDSKLKWNINEKVIDNKNGNNAKLFTEGALDIMQSASDSLSIRAINAFYIDHKN